MKPALTLQNFKGDTVSVSIEKHEDGYHIMADGVRVARFADQLAACAYLEGATDVARWTKTIQNA